MIFVVISVLEMVIVGGGGDRRVETVHIDRMQRGRTLMDDRVVGTRTAPLGSMGVRLL